MRIRVDIIDVRKFPISGVPQKISLCRKWETNGAYPEKATSPYTRYRRRQKFLFRCSLFFLLWGAFLYDKSDILNFSAKNIIFCEQKKIIFKPEHKEHLQITAYCDSRRAFFNQKKSRTRNSRLFGKLLRTKPPAQTGKLYILAHRRQNPCQAREIYFVLLHNAL